MNESQRMGIRKRMLVSRRWLARGAVALLVAAVAVGGIAACGGDDDDDVVAADPAELGDQLRDILGEPTNLMEEGPGEFPIMHSLPLTGPGAVYAEIQGDGFEFGAQHVEAWTDGGLSFEVEQLDHRSGDPEAGVANVRTAANAGHPILNTSYIFAFGAQPPEIERQEIFTMDPSGGTGTLFQGVPYVYGWRASWPEDMQDGLWMTIRELHPDAERWAVMDGEVSPEFNRANEEGVRERAEEHGVELVHYGTAPLGQEDYSREITALRQEDPDVVLMLTFGVDMANQAREMQRQGLDVIVGAVDLTPDAVEAAGPAMTDWYFGIDTIDYDDPPSDWTELFIETWEAEYGELPETFSASNYAAAFGFAILMDRILGFGGDIMDSNDWVKALEEDPTLPHVYGGDGEEIGEIVMDPERNSPEAIPMVTFQLEGTAEIEDRRTVATFDIGGRDFQLVKE